MAVYPKHWYNMLINGRYSHIFLLLFWPVYGIVFGALEAWTNRNFFYVHVPIDDKIPFCEYFIIPYWFWFVFMISMLVYTFFADAYNFRRYMWFIIITYSFTCLIYIIFPNAQALRPQGFEVDNIFSKAVVSLYRFDTNTNVCPSIHVIGSVAVCIAAFKTERFKKPLIRICFVIVTVLISISTVFLKQHSVIDVIAGIAVCAAVYPVIYGKRSFINKL